MLREEYSHLVGKDEFDEIYRIAVGKGAQPYSFLTILPHEQDEKRMFLARFQQRLFVEDSDDEEEHEARANAQAPPQAAQPTRRR